MSKLVKFSEAVSIGLHAVVLIAKDDKSLAPLSEISAQLEVSQAHLSKVLQRLCKAGILNSVRGPAGGYSLKKKPSAISMLDILTAIDGPVEISKCLFDRPICCEMMCELGDLLGNAQVQIYEYLKKKTINEFAKQFNVAVKINTNGGNK